MKGLKQSIGNYTLSKYFLKKSFFSKVVRTIIISVEGRIAV